MVIGLELRHFKTYKGQTFIPMTSSDKRLSSFIGNNGIGKSSILEALDVVFNNCEWNINLEALSERGLSEKNRNQPYISLLLLIEKERVKTALNKKICEQISEYLLSKDRIGCLNYSELLKESKGEINKKYYLVMVGKQYHDIKSESPYFGSENTYIKEIIKNNSSINIENLEKGNKRELQKLEKSLNNFLFDILNIYSYIHIPTEVSINDFSRIEKDDIQKLSGKNIHTEISKIVSSDTLKKINDKLQLLIDNISTNLDEYSFLINKGHSKKIEMQALTSKIVEEYFLSRYLSKKSDVGEDIDVKFLSSGEKRKALIELSKAFLLSQSNNNLDKKDKYIIFAVDEPEASLNDKARFKQFDEIKKIKEISSNIQVFVSTHWYGYLSFLNDGIVNVISKKDEKMKFDIYDLFNIREKISQSKNKKFNELPNDITLKSINDLTQSIILSLQTEKPYNWLICEGSSEKIYLEYYLEDLIKEENLVILPVGGAKEVKRVFEHLELPLKDYKNSVKGKIYCLIDTDQNKLEFSPTLSKNGDICFSRLLYHNDEVNLVKNEYTVNNPTEIEDVLESNAFLETLKHFNDGKIDEILRDEKNINYNGEYSINCLDLRSSDKKCLKNFFDLNNGYRKIEFAKIYVDIASKKNSKINWIEEIKRFFLDNY